LPVEERAASGMALPAVHYTGVEGEKDNRIFVFRCRKNASRFRPGTRLRLSRENPRKPVVRMELVDDRFDGKDYILRLSGSVEDPETLATAEPWVLDEDVFDLLDTQMSILNASQESHLDAWLAGTEEIPQPPERSTDSRFATDLQGSMLTAFQEAVAPRPYYAVQGPPGSGKTHLLARLALYFALEENKRVLITAVSHQSIHHALRETYYVGRRMAEGHPGARELMAEGFYKLGASRGSNEGLPEGVRATLRVSQQKRPLIAGATLYAALHPAWGFSRHPFDVILFDEAGQAPLILGLAARLLARKAIFIGDDAQLPPVVQQVADEDTAPLARMSVIEFIRNTYEPPRMLRETRRLNSEICGVVSDCFYDGALAPTAEAAERVFKTPTVAQDRFTEIFNPDASLVFVDVPHEGRKSSSEEEARWAAAIAAEGVRCGLAAQEIGVIAPYRAQGNRIRFLLGKKSRIVTSTVERFQGQEREMIIISLTSSHLRYMARLAGFLFSPNRLNVAISRARTKVVLIGARKALLAAADAGDEAGPDMPHTRGFSVFRRILEAATLVDGSGVPPAPGMPVAAPTTPDAAGTAFEPGVLVEHPQYGAGRVTGKSVELIDTKAQWANEIRFGDGQVRLVIPSLTRPPMKIIQDSEETPT
jgi:DNA replication ATP-dependent helicase Dna2